MKKEIPVINQDTVKYIADNKFLRFYDIQYREGKHYYNASRRAKEDLMCMKNEEEFKNAYPDAVTCCVVLKSKKGKEDRLLLAREYRYPTGQFQTSPPAGVLDEEDVKNNSVKEALFSAAKREIKEETGLDVLDTDDIFIINPLMFSSPGMTDESNAYIGVIINDFDENNLSQDGAEGSEIFDGFVLVTKDEARKMLKSGADDYGIYYSIATYVCLTQFINDFYN